MEILRAKLFPQHGAQLMRDQILRMDKEWNVLPESDKTSVPHYFFWLMNPDNEAAAQMQHRLLIKEATTKQEETYNNVLNELSSERDDVFDNEQDWFKRELYDLDKQKECLDEYFYYFKKHTTKSMLKVHDNVHERWSQFSLRPNTEEATPVGNSDILLVDGQPKVSNHQLPVKERTHFIISLKVLDVEYHSTNPSKPPKYNSVGHVAFSTKEQFIDGKSYKVGLAGSGWCAPIYRTQCPSMKFSAWYMKILIMLCLNIRYCYAHVFAENSKSFGFIAKSGMAATRFQLKFLGFNVELKKSELISVRHENIVSQTQIVQSEVEPAQSSLRSVNSLEEYKILMGKIYGKSNFLITHLENLYYHPNFAGCYVDEQSQVSFQVWKCKYALDNQTQQQMPSYIVFNMTHLSQCDIPLIDQQCDHLLSNLKQVILPQLVKNSSFPSANIATLAFATHGGSIYQYLLRNYAHLESISFASLFYTFQDNFKLIGKKSQELDPVTKFLCQPGNAGEEKNLFLDMRDCTGKPMVWSDEIKETEMATILPQVSDAVFTYSGNAISSVERVASIPEATTITSSSSRMYASKL